MKENSEIKGKDAKKIIKLIDEQNAVVERLVDMLEYIIDNVSNIEHTVEDIKSVVCDNERNDQHRFRVLDNNIDTVKGEIKRLRKRCNKAVKAVMNNSDACAFGVIDFIIRKFGDEDGTDVGECMSCDMKDDCVLFSGLGETAPCDEQEEKATLASKYGTQGDGSSLEDLVDECFPDDDEFEEDDEDGEDEGKDEQEDQSTASSTPLADAYERHPNPHCSIHAPVIISALRLYDDRENLNMIIRDIAAKCNIGTATLNKAAAYAKAVIAAEQSGDEIDWGSFNMHKYTGRKQYDNIEPHYGSPLADFLYANPVMNAKYDLNAMCTAIHDYEIRKDLGLSANDVARKHGINIGTLNHMVGRIREALGIRDTLDGRSDKISYSV